MGTALRAASFFFSILPWWDGPQTRAAVEEQLEKQAPTVEITKTNTIAPSPFLLRRLEGGMA